MLSKSQMEAIPQWQSTGSRWIQNWSSLEWQRCLYRKRSHSRHSRIWTRTYTNWKTSWFLLSNYSWRKISRIWKWLPRCSSMVWLQMGDLKFEFGKFNFYTRLLTKETFNSTISTRRWESDSWKSRFYP